MNFKWNNYTKEVNALSKKLYAFILVSACIDNHVLSNITALPTGGGTKKPLAENFNELTQYIRNSCISSCFICCLCLYINLKSVIIENTTSSNIWNHHHQWAPFFSLLDLDYFHNIILFCTFFIQLVWIYLISSDPLVGGRLLLLYASDLDLHSMVLYCINKSSSFTCFNVCYIAVAFSSIE